MRLRSVLALALVAVPLAACGEVATTSAPASKPAVTETSIAKEYTESMNADLVSTNNDGLGKASADCVETTERHYQCQVSFADYDETSTAELIVSPSGKWIAHAID